MRHLLFAVTSVAVFVLPACGPSGDRAGEVAPVAVTPAPTGLTLTGNEQNVVFRYVDPETGRAASARNLDAIPEASRGEVVVFDMDQAPAAGWTHVADLRQGLPATTSPRRDFSLRVAVTAPKPAPNTLAAKKGGTKQVAMFSTQGCGYCGTARRWFKQQKVPYSEYDLETDPSARGRMKALAKKAGIPEFQLGGVPIIFVGTKGVIGWDQARLKRLLGR